MHGMFWEASSFNQDISNWSPCKNKDFDMFWGSGIKDGDYGFSVPTPLRSQFKGECKYNNTLFYAGIAIVILLIGIFIKKFLNFLKKIIY